MARPLNPKYLSFFTSTLFGLAAGLLLGASVVLVVRLASYNPALVHYHANVAVYLNGRRQVLKGPNTTKPF